MLQTQHESRCVFEQCLQSPRQGDSTECVCVCVCAYVHYLCAELSPFIPRHVCEMSLLCKHDVLIIHVMY